ncbi:antirestriction protein ArdA [Labrenzia sp. THAF82]|uniref:antirestriction protein ArdA n=1 Tax=Labrenzia sp. THAF82 TaxID=2587861 RepID=UPI001267F66A|nr:antirestriction protein ArdA [Labrenzia sp. THAF82]
MTIQLHAQPYDIISRGFYFCSADEFDAKAKTHRNAYGGLVEDHEIQFIDGKSIDCELARAWRLHQGNFADFLGKVEEWSDDQKTRYIIAVGECGFDHADVSDDPYDTDIDLYEVDDMRELAEQFVDEGLFGVIPEHLENYIDYDAIARDLAMDYTETVINGQSLIYRCA